MQMFWPINELQKVENELENYWMSADADSESVPLILSTVCNVTCTRAALKPES